MKRFTSIILGFVLILGVIKSYILFRDSEVTPLQAVEMYIARVTKNAPEKVQDIKIVSSVPSSEGEILTILFRANGQPSQMHIAGYAVLRKTWFGWYVNMLQMTAKFPLPEDMMASLQLLEEGPVVFGQVFLVSASKVEAIFNDPNTGQVSVSAEIPAGNFVLFGSPHSELEKIRILDSCGNILKHFAADGL